MMLNIQDTYLNPSKPKFRRHFLSRTHIGITTGAKSRFGIDINHQKGLITKFAFNSLHSSSPSVPKYIPQESQINVSLSTLH